MKSWNAHKARQVQVQAPVSLQWSHDDEVVECLAFYRGSDMAVN